MIFKCKMCGGTLDVKEGQSIAECEFCGTKQTIPVTNNEKSFNLHNRANALRLRNEFDKAIIVYENILTDNPDDVEAHWGLLLCKYGIEYVGDPLTGKKIPTCHRTQFDSVFSDPDYKAAIKNADILAREVYESEAKEIDGIQKHILEISQKEERFDVFLCYKETDENGQRTIDSVIAQDVYSALTQKGYKVFFSRITLETKLGEMYEPYIFAALNSAKVMLVIGTKESYFNAVWVRNEWSRFIKIMERDHDKYLIPCYKDMDAYDLPMEMASFQAQDMGKIGFLQDLLYGIDKLFGKTARSVKTEEKPTTVIQNSVNCSALLERAQILIEDGDTKKADSLLEKVLNNDPKNAKAYFYKLLIDLNVKSADELNNFTRQISSEPNYIKAYRFADENFKKELNEYSSKITENIELEEKESKYQSATSLLNSKHYEEALQKFETLIGYKDVDTLISKCRNAIEKHNLSIYDRAINLINEYKYADAIYLLKQISNYKESDGLLKKCEIWRKQENVYRSAVLLADNDTINSLSGAVKQLKQIGEYRDSLTLAEKYNQRIIEIKRASAIKKSKTIRFIKIASPIVAAVIAFTLLTSYLFIPLTKYNQAEKAYKNGDYDTAISLYDDLYRNHHDFKNAASKINPTKYKKADSFVENGEFTEAQKIFEELGDFENSADRVNLTKASENFSNGNYIDGINLVVRTGGIVNVTFGTDGGAEIPNKRFYDTIITSENILSAVKVGYTFVKWEISEWNVDTTPSTYDRYKASITLKAVYAANSYNLAYELNGGACDNLTEEYVFGAGAELPVPARKGYTFDGWSFGENERFFAMPAETFGDKKLYANWTANAYTITYNANGGTLDDNAQSVVYDSNVTLKTPSRDAYTFAGWYNGDVLVSSGVWTIADNVTLVARWTKINFKITYNLNGGTNDGDNPLSYVISEKDITINDPAKTGYTFLGWSVSDSNEKRENYVIEAGVWGDLSLTANWQANTYAITYDYNDGATEKTTQNVTFDSAYKLIVPTRNGYDFNGWYIGDEKITDGTYKTASDIILKATWKIITYTISYDLGGGTVATANSTKYTVETATFTLNNPTKTGYTFTGWILGDSDVKNLTAVIEKGSFGDLTFTACYAANNYTLSFNVNGGDESITAITVTYDKSFTLPTPVRTGYTFDGWVYNGNKITNGIWKYTDNIKLSAQWVANDDTTYSVEHYLENADNDKYTLVYTDKFTGTTDSSVTPKVNTYDHFTSPSTKTVTISPDGNLVVRYFYTRKSYTVSFFSNGGKSILPKTQKYESTLSVNTFRIGYDFGGWYYEESLNNLFSGKMSGENFNLYAYWLGETLTNEFEYKIEDSVATITKFTGKSTNVVIPTYINDTVVSVIGNRAFENCTELKNITLTDGYIETIEGGAFYNCTGLTSVVIPDSVQSMGIETFAGCSNLESLTIPFVGAKSGVKSTDSEIYSFGYIFGMIEYANSYSSRQHTKYDNGKTRTDDYRLPMSLKTVNVSGGEILDYAFENCTYIETISVPDSITQIGESAFSGCVYLKSFDIPSGVTEIKQETFKSCESLVSITVPANVTTLDDNCFSYCTSLTNITLPDGLQKIDFYAFEGCKSLTNIVIPDSVTEISPGVFANCESLESLTVPFCSFEWGTYEYSLTYWFNSVNNGDKYDESQYYMATKCSKDPSYGYMESDYALIPLCLNRVVLTQGESVWGFVGLSSLTSVVLPDTVKNIEDRAFLNCTNLNSINLPTNLQQIGASAFSGCAKLERIDIPDSVTEISASAFSICYGIKSIKLPNNIKKIEDSVFYHCSSIESISIPDNVQLLGASCFSNCSSLSNISFGNGVDYIGESAFTYCLSLENLDIPNNITYIGKNAFKACSNLRSITLGTGLTTIDNNAFYQCDNIVNVNIDDLSKWCNIRFESPQANPTFYARSFSLNGVKIADLNIPLDITTIAAYTFVNCTELKSVTIPSTVQSIGSSAFSGCENLTSLNLSNGLQKIGIRSFENCFGLTQVNIPNTVTSIENQAFRYCKKLWNVSLSGTLVKIGDGAFWDCVSLVSIVIPETVTSIVGDAFSGCYKLIEVINNSSALSINKGDGEKSGFVAYNALKVIKGESEIVNCDDYLFYTFENVHYLVGYTGNDENIVLPSDYNGESYTVYKCAFAYQDSINSITYQTGIDCIQESAFMGCNNIQSLYIESIEEWCSISFSGAIAYDYSLYVDNALVSDLIIPETVTTLNSYVFAGCASITTLTIPATVTEINNGAFDNCVGLKHVNMLANVHYLKQATFFSCINLESIILSDSVHSIEHGVFYDCRNLKNVYCLGELPTATESDNSCYISADKYLYRQEQPTISGNYWHYDTDGITPKIWEIETHG